MALSATAPGCGGQSTARAAPPPVEVGVVTLEAETVRLTTELPGRTVAYETSEVRPQVSGIIRARLFSEGQRVEKGQTLYQIDARLYRADAARARANLASARASEEAARIKAERFGQLLREQVVSEQDFTEATASAQQAAASVQQAQAALETATINLRFTEVPAAISGRIGRSQATTGALVTAGQPDALTTIQRLDPMFVDMQESSSHLLAMRRSLASGGAPVASVDVRLILEDGSEYPTTGRLQFAEATVDPNTGSVALRARFDNPDGLLLPGMYVRAIVAQSDRADAILAPQPGITRGPKGDAKALVVGPDDKVVAREVAVARVVDDRWLVDDGLSAGDRLIVEGTDKVKPGQIVRAVAVDDAHEARRTGRIAPAGSPPASPTVAGEQSPAPR